MLEMMKECENVSCDSSNNRASIFLAHLFTYGTVVGLTVGIFVGMYVGSYVG